VRVRLERFRYGVRLGGSTGWLVSYEVVGGDRLGPEFGGDGVARFGAVRRARATSWSA